MVHRNDITKNIISAQPSEPIIRNLAVLLGVALTAAACGLSSPGASDIAPYVMDDLGQCPLWTISDIRKVDGIAARDSYRVDFTAKLTLTSAPEDTNRNYIQHQGEPGYMGCHVIIPHLATVQNRTVILSKQYDVSGMGELVKSEKGWRLQGELRQYRFMPVAGSASFTIQAPVAQ